MSLFKRLSATMYSRVDQVVSEIENHDAVVDTAIRHQQRALATARARFNRLQADGRRLQQRLEELRTSEAQWTRRAKEQAGQNEQIALQCMHKRRDCQAQIGSTENTLAEHRRTETRLATELETMEERINRVKQQKNLLRTRQSTADAMRTLKAIEDHSGINIDDTFEKWEIKVTEAELTSGDLETSDSLEQRFIEAEELEDLQAELKELIEGEDK